MSETTVHTDSCGCANEHPLQRDGSSQTERLLKALDPSYVAVDERSIDDLIRFVAHLAGKIQYYNTSNLPDGDWEIFLRKDPAVLASMIAGTSGEAVKLQFEEQLKATQREKENNWADFIAPNQPEKNLNNYIFSTLYPSIRQLMLQLNTWYESSDERLNLRKELDILFRSIFLDGYTRLYSLHLRLSENIKLARPLATLEVLNADTYGGDFPDPSADWLDVLALELNEDWVTLLQEQIKLTFPAGEEAQDPYRDLFIHIRGATDIDARVHFDTATGIINAIFGSLRNALVDLVARIPNHLNEALENFPSHRPHVALLIAFIKLFTFLQKHLNGLTERHLDFYYREVLHLAQRPAVEDQVHVVFELAKVSVGEFMVPQGTLLKAGKDSEGKPLVYETQDEIAINPTQAAAFKSIYVDRDATGVIQGIYAAPQANSADGQGTAFSKDETKHWRAFGWEKPASTDESQLTLPEAAVGFAIASPQLLLAEGRREIHVSVHFNKDLGGEQVSAAKFLESDFFCEVTTGKVWTTLPWMFTEADPLPRENIYFSNKKLTFRFLLDESMPAVVAWDEKKHGGTYQSEWPVLRIRCVNSETSGTATNAFERLKDISVDSISVVVDVKNVRNLILQNDQYKVDPAKPFQPFGVQAPTGASFYIGSEEIFYKKVTDLKLRYAWHQLPEVLLSDYYLGYDEALGGAYNPSGGFVKGTAGAHTKLVGSHSYDGRNLVIKASVEYLNDRKWTPLNANKKISLFNQEASDAAVELSINNRHSLASGEDPNDPNKTHQLVSSFDSHFLYSEEWPDEFTTLDSLVNTTQRGFIRFTLDKPDFQHLLYAPALIKSATFGKDFTGIINPPYTPMMKYIEVDYHAKHELDNTRDSFFQIHPFGEAKIDLPGDTASTGKPTLLPQFQTENPDGATESATGETSIVIKPVEAVFCIGLSGLVPEKSVAMLIQVTENSGNPAYNPPQLAWSYLRNNEWVLLNDQQVVSDTTRGLLNSGVVELVVPEDATSDNTILTSGLHWVRAAAIYDSTDPDMSVQALCRVLSIHTQAVLAKFKNQNNAASHLANALEAKTITKLDTSIPEVKSVSQPYSSFGGKLSEEGNAYYRRISERLRHKGRGIGIWDYERLVLEQYPSVFKVKCISHAYFGQNPYDATCRNNIAPGNVCLTIVSNLRNQNDVNKLRPTTSRATLEEIQDFLKKRTSRFAAITAINPKYEGIKVCCEVKLKDEYNDDKGYYLAKLNDEIKQFLSPWAFDEGTEIVFGGKMQASTIINFIDERGYVEYIRNFSMYLLNYPEQNDQSLESALDTLWSVASITNLPVTDERVMPLGSLGEAVSQTAVSILISADNHLLKAIS